MVFSRSGRIVDTSLRSTVDHFDSDSIYPIPIKQILRICLVRRRSIGTSRAYRFNLSSHKTNFLVIPFEYHMDMICHHDVFVYFYVFSIGFDILNLYCTTPPDIAKYHLSIHNLTKIMLTILRTYRHKISTRRGIIISLFAWGFTRFYRHVFYIWFNFYKDQQSIIQSLSHSIYLLRLLFNCIYAKSLVS